MTDSKQKITCPSSSQNSTEQDIIHLDYSLKTLEERIELVKKITSKNPSQLNHKYLEILADYILDARPKAEKKDKTILTNNRLVTINKRETSYEDLVGKFENGEDGLSNLIIEADKNIILSPKISISKEDIEEIPGLKELQRQIQQTETAAAQATGKRKYLLKKTLIEMRQDQYVLKQMFKQPITPTPYVSRGGPISLDEGNVHFDENGEPISDALISFFNPLHIQAILCNYDILTEGLRGRINNDFHYLMEDFDKLKAAALSRYPIYSDLVEAKIAGKSNLQIQQLLSEKYGKKYSIEYISALWRKKIPKIISEKAKEDYLIWYYTYVERGNWKRCSRCGELKLALPRFFSKNNTSKDTFYSICKECRNKKKGV